MEHLSSYIYRGCAKFQSGIFRNAIPDQTPDRRKRPNDLAQSREIKHKNAKLKVTQKEESTCSQTTMLRHRVTGYAISCVSLTGYVLCSICGAARESRTHARLFSPLFPWTFNPEGTSFEIDRMCFGRTLASAVAASQPKPPVACKNSCTSYTSGSEPPEWRLVPPEQLD